MVVSKGGYNYCLICVTGSQVRRGAFNGDYRGWTYAGPCLLLRKDTNRQTVRRGRSGLGQIGMGCPHRGFNRPAGQSPAGYVSIQPPYNRRAPCGGSSRGNRLPKQKIGALWTQLSDIFFFPPPLRLRRDLDTSFRVCLQLRLSSQC